MDKLTVVVWKWHKAGYRSCFSSDAVNTAASMYARHLKIPHEIVCVTDDATGISSDVRVVDIRELPSFKWMSVPNPSNPRNPSCYVRLAIYHPKASCWFGNRIVSSDLDIVATGDLTPLFDIEDDFAIWGGQTINPRGRVSYNWYNGSLQYVVAGKRSIVWNAFDPRISPLLANRSGCRGSDQGWIAYKLGHREKTWGCEDGVYSYRVHILPNGGSLPENAKFVSFHGKHDPWNKEVQEANPWVREHYR